MGRRHYYKPGSWYRIDDRTGFAVPAENTRKEWTGLIVREQSWEPRQPQDFVRGTVDEQTVPDPRPRTPPRFVPIAVTSLTAAAGQFDANSIGQFEIGVSVIDGGAFINVADTSGWLVNDVLWIMQNNGQYFRTLLTALPGATVGAGIGSFIIGVSAIGASVVAGLQINPPIVLAARAGNAVVNQSAQARIAGNAYPGMFGAFTFGENAFGKDSLFEFGPQLETYPDQDFSR